MTFDDDQPVERLGRTFNMLLNTLLRALALIQSMFRIHKLSQKC